MKRGRDDDGNPSMGGPNDLERYYGRFMASVPCPSCGGARLRWSQHVLVGGTPIHEIVSLTHLRDAAKFIEGLQFVCDRCFLI